MNAFKYGCVVGGKWYCPRPFLERELRRFLTAGQNVVIQGERRMGKTSLAHETLHGLRGWRLVYIDLLNIRSVGDFGKRVLSGVREALHDESVFHKALRLLPRLRPVVNYDPLTGGVGYSLDVKAASDPSAVEEIVAFLAAQTRTGKVAVVFDEFQDILNLPDAQSVLALLRGKIQFQADVPYVFTGSVRNAMSDLFDNPDSAFYKSAVSLCVGEIDRADFSVFLRNRFKDCGKRVSDEVLDAVMTEVDNIPGDVQELCEGLCDVTDGRRAVEAEDIASALKVVYAREGDKFEAFTSKLSPIQFKMLVALAVRGGVNVQSVAFLSEAGVGNAASARRALNRLEELRYIYRYRGEWKFTSAFFKSWMRRFA